jgi:hypothetical protein
MYMISAWPRLFLVFLVPCLFAAADQTVYRIRSGIPNVGYHTIIYEPLFNPKSIWASVGEKINFQVVLQDVSHIPVRSLA